MLSFHVVVCNCGVTFQAFLPRGVLRPSTIFCPFCSTMRTVVWDG